MALSQPCGIRHLLSSSYGPFNNTSSDVLLPSVPKSKYMILHWLLPNYSAISIWVLVESRCINGVIKISLFWDDDNLSRKSEGLHNNRNANNIDNRNNLLLIGLSILKSTWKGIVALCASNNSIKIIPLGKALNLRRTLDSGHMNLGRHVILHNRKAKYCIDMLILQKSVNLTKSQLHV